MDAQDAPQVFIRSDQLNSQDLARLEVTAGGGGKRMIQQPGQGRRSEKVGEKKKKTFLVKSEDDLCGLESEFRSFIIQAAETIEKKQTKQK